MHAHGAVRMLISSYRSIITFQLDAHQRVVLNALHDVVAREHHPYYTENDHYYKESYCKWLWHYRNVNQNAHRYRIDQSEDSHDEKCSIEVLPVEEPPFSPSRYDDEMKVMASVRAYTQVAYKV